MESRTLRPLCLLLCLPLLAIAAPDPADYNGFDVADASVPLAAIQRGGPPKDGIPAIDQPKFVAAAQGRPDRRRPRARHRRSTASRAPIRCAS